ncbi:Stp1/IreP family PP2C-type Ser/Thr phosphatase [Peptoniphilus sp. MSJ-1]|uniref:Stp1/IreP family PP2C-type Ser/Thr phosphatase n=1 Tax=Peptoniphilus ovalis TaxID=2841503 RepID=A0ABS6FI54_9FIRM|nr:Stp1/IreP family PP2C-type Ser/Thr phosphatase [Peptoniphilus ovalis]MBU5669118.1 Stp1/IreP family PP2C-type Ser/Thr phosphatase [Peptoniphilus ovalis]
MKVISATNVGNYRTNNEDSYYVDESEKLFILADGMGGHLAGEQASKMATEIIAKEFENIKNYKLQNVIETMATAVKNANNEIFEKSANNDDFRGMGTTVSLGYNLEEILVYANVGDSRIYKLNKDIEQLTKDDSFVNYLIEIGEITQEESKHHPKKNVLTKALGTTADIDVYVNTLNIEKNDIFLFCSDGLTNMVSDVDIFKIIKENSPEDAGEKLMELALENGGMDNITFIIVFNE